MKCNLKIKLSLTQDIIFKSSVLEKSNFELENRYFSKEKKELQNFEIPQQSNDFIDFLLEQVNYMTISPQVKKTLIYLIYNLSNFGYLDKYNLIKSEYDKDRIQIFNEAYEILKKLEPCGVGAINLKDCLKNQLKPYEYEDYFLKVLIENYLEDLAEKRYDKISREIKISTEKIIEKLKIIQKLNPIPTRGFNTSTINSYILPEAIIKSNKNGEYTLEINEDILKNLNSSNILPKIYSAIYRRQILIQEILTEIIKKNNNLSMTTLSKILKVDISTISRAIKEKYILLDNEIITIKNFLKIHSLKESIKSEIKELIRLSEEKLTDEQLCLLLKTKGIELSRRTVNKYVNEIKRGK
ncbi:hypothetical protein H5J22_00705 [Cetobacterium sp. 8H]|uniref:RNA polymerase factor sigma-54 n=1 Tax=Cetobacterium sp. 8H TaxID=2759681 RepID=UPI00163D1C8D|nr:hypothetical protein [Cetobacterium sp. 8H]MBC2849980.1 hypothetical protein [Cetobacterium sp. 8H]